MGKREAIRSGAAMFAMGIAFIWVILTVRPPGALQAQAATPESATTSESEQNCTVSASALNMRNGPSVQYDKIGAMSRGDSFTPIVRIEGSSWIFGRGGESNGWVAASLLRCTSDISELPIMEFPLEPCQVNDPAIQNATTASSTTISKSGSKSSGGSTSGGAASTTVDAGDVTLIAPLTDVIQGREVFRWGSSVELQPGQAYEMVFWEPGQDPMITGFSLVGAKPATEIAVNLDKAVRFVPQLESGKEYQWGVLVVQRTPYNRLKFLGGGHQFTFLSESGEGGGSANSGPLPGTAGK